MGNFGNFVNGAGGSGEDAKREERWHYGKSLLSRKVVMWAKAGAAVGGVVKMAILLKSG